MVPQGIRVFGRLSQLTSCLENRRLALLPWTSERVAAFYSTNSLRHDSDSNHGKSSIAPIARRAYATTGKPVSRPKAHTGRTTSSPRRKAAPKTATAKKPAAVKKVTKPKAKPKPKPKPKAKPKKPQAKPKPKRKVLTEKGKARQAAAKESLELKNLKAVALKPPKALSATAWFVFNQEALAQADTSHGVRSLMKEASQRYKNIAPEQLEHYNHLANENKAKNQTNYRKWIESYTPAQIRQANLARMSLRRRIKKPRSWPPLRDERQVAGFKGPYIFFFTERRKSGDYHGIKATEIARLIAKEYKALSADELKKYKDMAAQDMARYEQEYKAVYNIDIQHPAGSPHV